MLRLVEEGLAYGEIGERISISERTVMFQVSWILSKLGAKNRTEAVRLVRNREILSG